MWAAVGGLIDFACKVGNSEPPQAAHTRVLLTLFVR
jgi:hypothetical protein